MTMSIDIWPILIGVVVDIAVVPMYVHSYPVRYRISGEPCECKTNWLLVDYRGVSVGIDVVPIHLHVNSDTSTLRDLVSSIQHDA